MEQTATHFFSRTGDSEIDALIDSMITDRGYARYAEADEADGRCYHISQDAKNFFIRAGLEAWVPQPIQQRDSYFHWELTPELFGYTDRPEVGHPTHYWVCVKGRDGRVHGLDFTAAQYGITEHFPMVQTAQNREPWSLKRVPRKYLPDPGTIAERRAANSSDMSDHYLRTAARYRASVALAG